MTASHVNVDVSIHVCSVEKKGNVTLGASDKLLTCVNDACVGDLSMVCVACMYLYCTLTKRN